MGQIVRVLVVDDEPIIRKGIIQSIDWEQYEVEMSGEASNGKEALALVKEKKPDIVITDIRMPVMDGLELAKNLENVSPPVKTIILSGYGEFGYAQKAIKYKVSEFIVKPVGAEELIRVVLKLKNEIITERKRAEQRRFYEVMIKENYITYINRFCDEEKELQFCFKQMDQMGVNHLLDHLIDRFIFEKADHHCIRNISLFFLFSALKTMREMGISAEERVLKQFDPFLEIEKLETAEEIREWLKNVFKALLCIIENEKREKYKYIVKFSMDFFVSHYKEPISLKKIAKKVHVTPNYFSKVFREETGENFIEWLNKFRVEKAKEMILELGMKTYEVAEEVGFNNYKHFTYNFKKYTGLSPTKFRDRNITAEP